MSQSMITSPSSLRLNLIVPCEAGWDGPIWISMISSVASRSSGATARLALDIELPPRLDRVPLGDERLALVDRVVLAQRITDELLVEEDAPQVRMSGEADAEHVPD